MAPRYNIYAFKWVKQDNAFYCESPILGMHPTDRKQFYIVNDETCGFRRFTYVKTYQILDVLYNQFKSEDDIFCAVKIIE